jgi:nucleotide sugar dehydrogenase
MKKKIAIIGHGVVGKAMNLIFPDALIYDKKYFLNTTSSSGDFISPFVEDAPELVATQETINKECELAIICVPTPPIGMKGEQKVNNDEEIFLDVDLSFIEETFQWLKTPLALIKSTIPPGTTDRLNDSCSTEVCFSPEYIGESSYYTPSQYLDPNDPRKHGFVIIGGQEKSAEKVVEFFKEKLGPVCKYFICSAKEAEAIKYLENTFFATKVTFVNEWYEICKALGINFDKIREGWLLDNRVCPMHTAVFKNKRGFSGHCFPKDLMGIVATSEKAGYEPKLLKEIWNTNKRMLQLNNK